MTEIAHRTQGQTALTITEDQASFNDTQLSALAQIGVDTNRPGDVAVLFGEGLDIDELAQRIGTIPYELLTNVSERVKRIFISE